jgi:hypothetical protein
VASQPSEALFDDIPRITSRPRTFTERLSTFHFVNHAAGERWTQARDLLESWYSLYPNGGSKDRLRKHFRNEDEGQHVGAWWELYTFALFHSLGYCVTVEPPLPNCKKKIDFLVSRDGASMYVECAVDGAADGPATGNPKIEAGILDDINKVQNRNFLVGVEFHEASAETPGEDKITGELSAWLAALDPDLVLQDIEAAQANGELGVLPEKKFSFNGWVFSCVAYPNAPDKRYEGGGLLGSRSSSPTWLNNVERLYKTVAKKGHKYGTIIASLDTQLIVAVLSVAGYAEQEDVTDAMFGRKHVRYYPDDARRVEVVRRRDGYWRAPPSDRGVRVSGVLFSHDMRPWSVASHLPKLWVNPWALNRVTEHSPFSALTVEDDGTIIERDATARPQDVFASPA